MIQLYHGTGARDIDLLGPSMSKEDWTTLRSSVSRLLRARKQDLAAKLLNEMPFEIRDATNDFGDEFSILYYKAPLGKYVSAEEVNRDSKSKLAFRDIAKTMTEVGPYIRFIAVELDTKTGPLPVTSPSFEISSDAVECALADAEQLIASRGAVSGVDRVHTAFHGYLKAVCQKNAIVVPEDAGITSLFKVLREHHQDFAESGARASDTDRVVRAMATILDALDPVRNRASLAHPNEAVLDEPEAMLVINSIRTLLHYLNAKLE
jgi:hypothetical protein